MVFVTKLASIDEELLDNILLSLLEEYLQEDELRVPIFLFVQDILDKYGLLHSQIDLIYNFKEIN